MPGKCQHRGRSERGTRAGLPVKLFYSTWLTDTISWTWASKSLCSHAFSRSLPVLFQVSEILEDKRAEMQSAAGNEDYEAAIVARDACHQLELQQRSLQLSLDSHLRSTVLHSLGTPFSYAAVFPSLLGV